MDAFVLNQIPLLAASSWLSQMPFYLYTAMGLGFVIFVHELGHFLVAKWCGVKCEKFYIGFDVPMPWGIPSKLFRYQWGETEYGIGIIPLGGYVKMLGQDDNPANAAKERERSRLNRESSGALPQAAATAADGASQPSGSAGQAEESFVLDPRSYMAKSVPQRMAIISAGVIMNLIFAVIFASVAYSIGVKYTPCVIGGTVPGDAAWKHNIAPGSRILQIGREGVPNEDLRFEHLIKKVFFTRGERELDILVRSPTGEETWKSFQPSMLEMSMQKRFLGWKWMGKRQRPTIGITSQFEPVLGKPAGVEHLPAGKANLMPSDRIVAVEGAPVNNYRELQLQLAAHSDKTISIDVERTDFSKELSDGTHAVERLRVSIDPDPMKWFGFYCELGPVIAVRPGSPAETAGIKVGDRLTSVADQPLGDVATLGQRLAKLDSQEVPVTLERKNEAGKIETLTVRMTPQPPEAFEYVNTVNRKVGLESVGVALSMNWIVAHVEPGSPAGQGGLKAGDELLKATLVQSDEAKIRPGAVDSFDLQESAYDPMVLHDLIQQREAGLQLTLIARRGDELKTITNLKARPYSTWCNVDRGFIVTRAEGLHQAKSPGEAMQLGAQETWDGMTEVASVLSMLATGQLEVTNLGGPGTIVAAAAGEASEGTSRLLIFLTLLSANLAIINFLPIPVLDGGHFVFLAYEGIFGKPANERIATGLTVAGLCMLLALMAFVIGMDVARAMGII